MLVYALQFCFHGADSEIVCPSSCYLIDFLNSVSNVDTQIPSAQCFEFSFESVHGRFSPTYQVEGSKGSVLLWQLNDYSLYGTKRLDSIITAFNDLCKNCNGDTVCIQKQKPALDSIFKEAFREQQDYVVNFLERNKGSLATLIALYKMYNGNPLINPDTEDFAFYEEVADALEKSLPDNKHTIDFRNTVEKKRFQRQQQMEKAPQVVVNQGNM